MRCRPRSAIRVDAPLAQQEALQLLARLAHLLDGIHPGTDEVAHRFMRRIGHSNRDQLTSSVQARQGECIATVGFDVIAGADRNQRGRDDTAIVAALLQLSMQSVAAWSGLIAERQPARMPLGQLLQQARDRRGTVGDLA